MTTLLRDASELSRPIGDELSTAHLLDMEEPLRAASGLVRALKALAEPPRVNVEAEIVFVSARVILTLIDEAEDLWKHAVDEHRAARGAQ